MDVSYLLARWHFVPEKLTAFGFHADHGVWTYAAPLGDLGVELHVTLTENTLTLHVYDPDMGENYLPFEMPNDTGAFAAAVREAAEAVVRRLQDECTVQADGTARIVAYARAQYGTETEQPWEKYPGFCTLKTPENKWYGLVMPVPAKVLGLVGTDTVTVLNVKAAPEKVVALPDGRHYFPAYHMNKKHWLSILIDSDLPDAAWQELLQESYSLAGGKDWRGTAWIIPANPKYYDFRKGLEENPCITWKQTGTVRKGETVYLYSAAPDSAILYKCRAIAVDLAPESGLKAKRMMTIAKVEAYPDDLLTLERLKPYGFHAVRSGRRLTADIVAHIEGLVTAYKNEH